MIEEEIHRAKAGEEAYIGLKMNSLTDKKIIDKLIRASEAGVKDRHGDPRYQLPDPAGSGQNRQHPRRSVS